MANTVWIAQITDPQAENLASAHSTKEAAKAHLEETIRLAIADPRQNRNGEDETIDWDEEAGYAESSDGTIWEIRELTIDSGEWEQS